MSNILPILRNTTGTLNAQVLYPFVRTVSFLTHVDTFMNGSEQRWAGRPPLYGFNLPMGNLNPTDKAAWLTFFNTVKGRFTQDLQLSLGATTYSNLTLQTDGLAVDAISSFRFNQGVSLRQLQNGTWTPPTAGTTYPTFSFGKVAEVPFTQNSEFITMVNDNPYGPRFSWAWYAAGLTNFPTTYLRTWKLEYPILTDTDLATLENFFISQQGRYISFTFQDPLDGINYTHVRFDMDALVIKYITKNINSTTVTLRQTNGS